MSTASFIGRHAECRSLREQIHLACNQGPRLVLLSAPAGTGKTALLQHFLHSVADQCTCAAGRGWDNRAAVSYHALREAVLQLPQPRRNANTCIRAFLSGNTGKKNEVLHPEALFPAITTFLQERARRRPLCLFLDDLQWADEGTLEWLDFAFRKMENAPLLLLGAYRSEEARSLDSLLRRRSQWYPTDRFSEYTLEPLSRSEVEELARGMIPEDRWQEELSTRIWERSEGLALLAVEEIRAWMEGRENTPQGQALIEMRMDNLAPGDRELLSLAAVIGERFDVEPLTAALDQDGVEVAQRLEKLRLEQALLTEDGDGFRFAHSRYREALLDGMSQALRQSYHALLSRQDQHLQPAERTYHLVHSGAVEQGIEALLSEGDQTCYLMDWRDALRYYVEALWQAQRAATQTASLSLAIYQRLGDLQLLAAGQHVVARSYYEAARCWARTPREQILLFCRLAETCRHPSAQALGYLEEAARLLDQSSDRALHNWVQFRQITCDPLQNEKDWTRIYQLCQNLGDIPDFPQELLGYVKDWALEATRRTRDPQETQRQIDLIPPPPANSWMAGRHHMALCLDYDYSNGNVAKLLEHAREARRIFEELGRIPAAIGACGRELDILIDIGAFQEAQSVLQKIEPGSVMEILYSCLCSPRIYDQSAEELEWATRYLRGIAAFFLRYPTDGGHMRKLLASLGMAERIFRDAGRQEDFHRRLDELRKKLGTAGYRTEGIWFLADPVDLPAVPPAASLESWNSTTGDGQAEVVCERNAITFQVDPHRPVTSVKIPRATKQVVGDFTLQATIHPGAAVLESNSELRRLQSTDQQYPLAKGGGGLLVIRDQDNTLEFSVHASAPSEVLLRAHCEGNRQYLGRGLLEDTPIHLRLERKGSTFYAYAGNPENHWHCCGQIDLPGWERVEVGLYGETTENLTQSPVEKGEIRFWNVGLQAVASQPAFIEEEDDLFPLPASTYASDLSGFVAASDKIRQILEQTRKIGDSFLPVLILGETGTGKELIARALHQLGKAS